MTGDTRKTRIAKIMVEFQVVEHYPAGFLLGRDALKAYKMIIDEEHSAIWINSLTPPMKVSITEDSRYDSRRIDSRIFIAEIICIKPGEHLFMPVKYQTPDEMISYIFTSPVRIINHDTGMYTSFFYSLIRRDTTHLCLINVELRPAKVVKDTIIAMYAPMASNTAYAYFNVSDMKSISKGMTTDHDSLKTTGSSIDYISSISFNVCDAFDSSNIQSYDILPVDSLTKVPFARFAECRIDEIKDTLGLKDTTLS